MEKKKISFFFSIFAFSFDSVIHARKIELDNYFYAYQLKKEQEILN